MPYHVQPAQPPRVLMERVIESSDQLGRLRSELDEELEPFADSSTRDEAALVLTELAANALVHGRPPVVISVAVEPGHVVVQVVDAGSPGDVTPLQPPPEDQLSPGGRGLKIVEGLCESFVLTREPSATGARATLRIARPPGVGLSP